MLHFFVGHATHPDWQGALALAAAQVQAQRAQQARQGGEAQEPTLGLVYFSDRYAAHAQALYDALRMRWPAVAWAGTVGVGVCAGGVEYFDEPALVLMLGTLPSGRFRVFSGARPLAGIEPASALVHGDANTHDMAELLEDLAVRMDSGYLFGGLGSTRTRACQIAEGVFAGGLSGVAFSHEVGLISRVTQGCQPVGPARRITAAERNLVIELDGRPALDSLLEDLQLKAIAPASGTAEHAGAPDTHTRLHAALRRTLVGLWTPAPAGSGGAQRHRAFGEEVRVRHLIGLDPARRAVAVGDLVAPGQQLAFCQRDAQAARRDLTRICAEIRDELAPDEGAPDGAVRSRDIAGALYVSCVGRGGPHFGGPSAELQIIRHALGDVPLAGFFAAGEIAHQQLHGYTGVLTVFTRAG